MFLAIDVGGSKTLLACFSADGDLQKSYKFPTSQDYEKFKDQLNLAIKTNFSDCLFEAAAIAIPGRIDRTEGMALGYGTLKWPPAPIKHDLEKLFGIKVLVENDAKLAGLYEAAQLKDKYQKVLYVTIGTGIGSALIVDGQIDFGLSDSEGGQIILERDRRVVAWEDLVSGRAILKRFGLKASEITDQKTWNTIAADLAEGLFDLIATVQPQVVVIGGGVGAHFDKFAGVLQQNLAKLSSPLVPIPPVIKAQKAEEAVIYGCYEFIKTANKNH